MDNTQVDQFVNKNIIADTKYGACQGDSNLSIVLLDIQIDNGQSFHLGHPTSIWPQSLPRLWIGLG